VHNVALALAGRRAACARKGELFSDARHRWSIDTRKWKEMEDGSGSGSGSVDNVSQNI